MVNEKKNIFHAFVVWFIIGFTSASYAQDYYLVPAKKFEMQEQQIAQAISLNEQSINKILTLKKQRTELNNNLQKANQSVITLEKQQTMLKTSYDNKIKYLESCNQTLEQESKEYKKKIKQLKAEKTLLYVGLGTVLLIAIS